MLVVVHVAYWCSILCTRYSVKLPGSRVAAPTSHQTTYEHITRCSYCPAGYDRYTTAGTRNPALFTPTNTARPQQCNNGTAAVLALVELSPSGFADTAVPGTTGRPRAFDAFVFRKSYTRRGDWSRSGVCVYNRATLCSSMVTAGHALDSSMNYDCWEMDIKTAAASAAPAAPVCDTEVPCHILLLHGSQAVRVCPFVPTLSGAVHSHLALAGIKC